MAAPERSDVIVIGRGLAARAAALEAARSGRAVLVVHAAGSTLRALRGRSPFAFLAARELALELTLSRRRSEPTSDRVALASRIAARAQALRRLRAALGRRLLALGARVETGDVTFTGPDEIAIAGRGRRRAPTLVIATGSHARHPARFPFAQPALCDADTVFARRSLPRSVAVLGAGPAGCELASVLAALGCRVTLLDRRNRLLRTVDRDVQRVLHDRLADLGAEVLLDEEIVELSARGRGDEREAQVVLASGRTERAECAVVIAGRRGNTDGLGLGRAGIECDAAGFVPVDAWGRTAQPGIVALGRVAIGPGAGADPAWQARRALGAPVPERAAAEMPTPLVVRSLPEVARCGVTEDECRAAGRSIAVGVAHYAATLAGYARSEAGEMAKLVASVRDRRVIGVQAVGHLAGELVALGAEVMRRRATLEDVLAAGVSAGALSELLCLAAADARDAMDAAGRDRSAAPVRLRPRWHARLA